MSPSSFHRLLGHSLALLLSAPGISFTGQFQPPVRLSGGQGVASQPDLGLLDVSFLAVFEEGGDLWLHLANGEPAIRVAEGVHPLSRPRMAVGNLGQVSVFFVASAQAGSEDLSLWVVDRELGAFPAPLEVASGFAAPPPHQAAYNQRGGLDLLWLEPSGDSGPPDVVLRKGSAPRAIARGELPQLAEGSLGFIHVAYLRDGKAFYSSDRLAEDFSTEVEIGGVPDVSELSLALDSEEKPHILLRSPVGLFLVTVSRAGVSETMPVAEKASAPRLTVGRDGAIGVAFLRDGLLLFTRKDRVGASFDSPVIISSPGLVDDHELKADSHGYFHMIFQAGGEVFYTNDVPPPRPLFHPSLAEVEQGQDLVFEDLSEGVITAREWDFGDGESSRDPSPHHSYREPGRYLVSLTTRGPGGARTYAWPDKIKVVAAPNVMRIPRVLVPPGQSGVLVPILLTSKISSRGFQVVVVPSRNLEIERVITAQTRTEDLLTEFVDESTEPNADGTALVVTALWDFEPPYDGRVLPPGVDQALLLLKLRLGSGAVAGVSEWIRFTNNIGPHEKSNLIVSGAESESVFPFTKDGEVRLLESAETVFLRGDSNQDLELGLSDAVFTLLYLFQGGEPPRCPDAADSNDDGDVDVSDAIETLYFLFSGRSEFPPYPYPGPGVDATEDHLPPCQG